MTENELNELRTWIIQMGKIVQKYGKGHYDHQLRGLMSIVNCIDSDADISEKENYIISTYKDLISSRGGLSDFCIFDNNYERRLELNKPYEEARKNIWNLISKFQE